MLLATCIRKKVATNCQKVFWQLPEKLHQININYRHTLVCLGCFMGLSDIKYILFIYFAQKVHLSFTVQYTVITK